MEKFSDYYLIPIINYKVIHPIYKSPLDLNLCNNTTITYNIPVEIKEDELFKYEQEIHIIMICVLFAYQIIKQI